MGGHVHRLFVFSGILPALLALLVASAIAQETKVSIAIVPSVPSASTLIAVEKGYFREAGLDVTIERIDSLSKAVALLATNQLQVAQGGINAGYFNAVGQGMPVVLALESGSTPVYHQIVVRPDLKNSIKTPADLKGRPVALSGPGSISAYELGMTLGTVGLRLADVDLKYLTFPQMGPALANGAVDAAVMVAPFSDLAIERKIASRWIDPEEGYIKSVPTTNLAYMANADWIRSNPDAARKLFLALARGGREYCQAYHHGPNRAEVIDILVKEKIVADRALLDRMNWQARNPNGAFNVPGLIDIQSFFHQEGTITKISAGEKLADQSFAAAAAKELGAFVLTNKDSKLQGCR